MILHLRAKPNAKANALQLAADGSLIVHLKAPPQEGQANAALLAFLAATFGTAKTRVILLAGHNSPFKKVELLDVSEEAAHEVLARFSG